MTYLDDGDPIPVENALAHELLHLLRQTVVHGRSLRRNLRHQRISLLLVSAFLPEYFRRLCQNDPDEELDDLPTEIRRRCMEKVLVDICEHSSAALEIIERAFETFGIRAGLGGGDSGVCSCDLKYDGCFLIGKGGLDDELRSERISPWEVDAYLRKSELE